jgi:hypothetical protein
VTKVYEGEAALLIDKQIARVGVAVEEARVEQLHQEHLRDHVVHDNNYCQTNVLLMCCQCVANVLLMCCQCVANVLPMCCQYVANLLPMCC